MSDSLVSSVVRQVDAVADLRRQERPGAAVTLTRTGTLAITTAGTLIAWQAATRANGFVFGGASSDVTIPTTGYYTMSLTYNASAVHVSQMRLLANGVTIAFMAQSSIGTTTRHGFMWTRYYTTGDLVSFNVLPSANVTMQVIAEGSTSESPVLHIVQLTGVI